MMDFKIQVCLAGMFVYVFGMFSLETGGDEPGMRDFFAHQRCSAKKLT